MVAVDIYKIRNLAHYVLQIRHKKKKYPNNKKLVDEMLSNLYIEVLKLSEGVTT